MEFDIAKDKRFSKQISSIECVAGIMVEMEAIKKMCES